MQKISTTLALCLLLSSATITAAAVRIASQQSNKQKLNPVEKTVGLLSQLQMQVVADGEVEATAYHQYTMWCQDTASAKAYEEKTNTRKKEKLEAEISKAQSDIEDATANIETQSTAFASLQGQLKESTEVRAHERSVFESDEKELMEAIEMLGKAIDVMAKQQQEASNPDAAALVQETVSTVSMQKVLTSLGSLVLSAGTMSDEDGEKFVNLLQGNLTAAGGGIVQIMEDLRDKSEGQLQAIRRGEANVKHNFELLKNSLEDRSEDANTEMEEQKKEKSSAQQDKAKKEGDLELTKTALADASKTLKDTQMTCVNNAADYERAVQGRKDELTALTKTKKIIQAAMAGIQTSDSSSGGSISFLQIRGGRKQVELLKQRARAVVLVKRLAKEQKSAGLMQLASRAAAAIRLGAASGEDPFAKVKSLIVDMIARLEKEQTADQNEKEYCDGEMSKTEKHKAELEDETDGLKGKLNQATSASANLKGEVKALQRELGSLEKLSALLDESRREEHAAFLTSKETQERGLNGLRTAKQVLREYYAADSDDESEAAMLQEGEAESASDGDDADGDDVSLAQEMRQPKPPVKYKKNDEGGKGIIALLEVCASDAAKELAELQTEETDSQNEYEKIVQENKVSKAEKEQAVELKTRDFKGLDKGITELKADFNTASQELDAVNEYYSKVKERCVIKKEPYEVTKARRKAEIEGLKEAISVLEGTSLLEK